MESLAPASLLMNGLLITVAIVLWQNAKVIHDNYLRVIKENIELRKRKPILESPNLIDLVRLINKPAPVFDEKTKKLLNLAISKTNENEARAAAVEACKRIHKQING